MPLLLLDLDNTLADRDAAFAHWLARKLSVWAPDDVGARSFVVEHDADGVRPRIEFLNAVCERFQLIEPVEGLLAEYRRLTLEGFPPVGDAVRRQLESMRLDGWKIAVVTNGDSEVQEATVERVGLTPLLDACVVSGSVGVRKPDARIFAIAAERCDTTLAGAWMVGDAEVDVIGAAGAGIQSAWLTRGRAWTRVGVRPSLIADSLPEALASVRAVVRTGSNGPGDGLWGAGCHGRSARRGECGG